MALHRQKAHRRRASVAVWTAMLMVVIVAMVAFGVDVGYMMLTRTQLQAAADSAAMAAAPEMTEPRDEMVATASKYAGYHRAAGQDVQLSDADVEYGVWDVTNRTFQPLQQPGNAVRVTARRPDAGLFFGRVLGSDKFSAAASAVAMANPRDIAFVIDLSGSMNDDTEPGWATQVVNSRFAPQGYPNIGSELMQTLYKDFGFGAFPGTVQYIGAPLGVARSSYAYAEMTKNSGPLANATVPAPYRIKATDNELTRKRKAYSWMIDYQIAAVMPAAKPTPDSSTNYDYWEKYLDYILIGKSVWTKPPGWKPKPSPPTPKKNPKPKPKPNPNPTPKPPPPPKPPLIGMTAPQDGGDWFAAWQASTGGPADRPAAAASPDVLLALAPGTGWQTLLAPHFVLAAPKGVPPYSRGWLPPKQDSDRIYRFNNPNKYTFPEASSGATYGLRNYIGYLTYIQFMLDHGRDLTPVKGRHVPLSTLSADCPRHSESTAGGVFDFPPRTQPMHAARRALIAAIQVVKERNGSIPDPNQRDWVSVISFDRLGKKGAKLVQPLTGDYDQAMQMCTDLQAAGDKGASTATEPGLIAARNHIKPKTDGGAGRSYTNKIVVLLTDGVPNAYKSSKAAIDKFIAKNPSSDWYAGGYYWFDAPIMQATAMQLDKWYLYPVGVGLGANYDFMDRLARSGATANNGGQSPRGSGNPAEYEQRLTEIFTIIITSPKARLVE